MGFALARGFENSGVITFDVLPRAALAPRGGQPCSLTLGYTYAAPRGASIRARENSRPTKKFLEILAGVEIFFQLITS